MKPHAVRNPNYPTGQLVQHETTHQPHKYPKSKPIKQDKPKPKQVSIKQIFHYLNIWDCEVKKKYNYVQQFQQYLLQKRESIAMEEIEKKLSKPDFVRFFKYLKERDDSTGDDDNNVTINIAYTAKERREQNAIKSHKKLNFPMVKESQLQLPTSFDPHKVIPTPSPDDFLIVSHLFKQCIEFEGQQQVAKDTLLSILLGSKKFCEAYELNKYLIEEQIRHYPTSDDEYITQDEFINFILYPKLTVIKVNTNESAADLAISILFNENQMKVIDQVFNDLNHDGLNYVDICRLVGSLRSRYETQSVLFLDFIQVGHMKYSLEKWVYQFEIWCLCNGIESISNHKLTELYTQHLSIPNKSIVMASQSLSKSKTHLKLYENDNSILPLSFFADLEQIIIQPQTLTHQVVDDILCNDAFILKYRKQLVRKQATNQLPIETVEATLDRIKIEASQYIDLDDLIDFFTIRGRPLVLSQKLKKIPNNNNLSNTPPDNTQTNTAKFGAINNINQQFLITIPNPKYEEPTKPKSLRQKQVEKMLLDNEKGVKKELDYKFKAHPVPWFVTEPLYDKMNRDREESRQKRKDESKAKLMESMMNPKSFEKLPKRPVLFEDNEEFQFKSRPIPNSTSDPLFEQIQQQQKDRSKLNVDRRKQEWEQYFAEYDTTKQTQDRLDEISMKHKRRSHSPQQHKMFRAKDMPDFEHLHEKFDIEMANKKAIFQPTVPMESVLSKQSTMIDCTMLDYENIGKSSAQDRIGNIDYRLKQVLNRPKPTILCTKKSRSISTLRKKQKYDKWREQQTEQEYVEQMKKERQSLLPKNMRVSNPAAKQQKLLDKELQDLVKWKKTYHRNLDKDYEKQLKKMNKKVRKKPLLMYSKDDQDYSSSSGGISSRTDISDRKQAYDYNYY